MIWPIEFHKLPVEDGRCSEPHNVSKFNLFYRRRSFYCKRKSFCVMVAVVGCIFHLSDLIWPTGLHLAVPVFTLSYNTITSYTDRRTKNAVPVVYVFFFS